MPRFNLTTPGRITTSVILTQLLEQPFPALYSHLYPLILIALWVNLPYIGMYVLCTIVMQFLLTI